MQTTLGSKGALDLACLIAVPVEFCEGAESKYFLVD